jgi:hypothetical protein
MKILETMSLSQLQTFNHIMTEMERVGVFNLAEARKVVTTETDKRHKARQQQKNKQRVVSRTPQQVLYGPAEKPYTPEPCPTEGCPGKLMKIPGGEFEVLQCKKCRYSKPYSEAL